MKVQISICASVLTYLRSIAIFDRRYYVPYKTSVRAELRKSRLSEIIDVLVELPLQDWLAAVMSGLRSNDTQPCLFRLW